MDIKQRVIELTTQICEINYDSEEDNLIKDSISEIANHKNFEADNLVQDNSQSNLRSINTDISLTSNLYQGKPVSRKRESFSDDDIDSDFENKLDSERNISEDETEDMGEEEEEDREGSESDDADTSVSLEKRGSKRAAHKYDDYNIYSTGTRNMKEDIKKGIAIRNQLGLWESLLECRIKLQKSLVASNKLPQKNDFTTFKSLFSADDKLIVEKTNKSVLNLLDKLLELQNKVLHQCTEFKSKSKNKIDVHLSDEEIPSSSGSENDEQDEEPSKKKIKLHEYNEVLKNKYQDYIPYRNTSIQKWNDKTKIASGKMANSNFSAFDHSTIKQIEQIMSDKERLINRTQMKRSEYEVLGTKHTTSKQETQMDKEIFDDDDFYHKLLRDFIERRSVDGTNSTQSERQWMELQKLRSKMKKKIDTKSTKGRKIRYVVLPKLVNFMAPVSYSTWNENAESELYSSLFGKITSR